MECIMGYQFSNQTKTLTHWQSGAGSGGYTPVDRLTTPFIGIVHNGMPYFFPFECWDPGASVAYVSRQSEYDQYTAEYPLLSNYYGYNYEVSKHKPLYSGYKWNDESKTEIHFSALYLMYENKSIEWQTRDTQGGYGKYDDSQKWVPYTSIDITADYSIKAGGTYGVAVPSVTAYVMLEGVCPASLTSNLPEWLQSYPECSGYYRLYEFEPPQFAPKLFRTLGKMDRRWTLILRDETVWKAGGGGFWGTSSALTDYDVPEMVSAGYCGLGPVSIAAASSFYSPSSTLGSCVSPQLRDLMPSVRIPIARNGIYYATTGSRRIYPIEGEKLCHCDLTITREPVSYGLTTGVLWKNEKIQDS